MRVLFEQIPHHLGEIRFVVLCLCHVGLAMCKVSRADYSG
jgi:hypothetical protein